MSLHRFSRTELLIGRDGLDFLYNRADGQAVFRADDDEVVELQRKVGRMKAVDFPLLLELDTDDIFQGSSPLLVVFFRRD